jgi:hypothetical protein
MLLTACIHLFLTAVAFVKIAEVTIGSGFLIALGSTVSIIFATFFFSKHTKEQSVEMRYLDHHDSLELDEYKKILSTSPNTPQKKEDGNMSLPI